MHIHKMEHIKLPCIVSEKLRFFFIYVEQELLTLPEQLSSSPVFSGFRVARC